MTPKPLTAEEKLLLLSARPTLDSLEEAQLDALLHEPLQWDWVVARTKPLRTRPLLHHHLARPGRREKVPPEALAAFEEAYRQTSMKNLQIYGALRRVLTALAEAGVPVILLKGAFLARWVYGDIGLRPMSDLDCLCHKEDEDLLWRVLDGLGAELDTQGKTLLADEKRLRVVEHFSHPPPRFLGKIVRIEVHFHLFSSAVSNFAQVGNDLWNRSIVHNWDGLPVRSLSWEHQILHLTSHLYNHLKDGAISLSWLADLHEILRQHRETLDWNELCKMAADLRVEHECQEVFALLKEPWPHPTPSFRSHFTLRQALTQERNPGQVRLISFMKMLRATRYAGGFSARFRFLVGLVFPSRFMMKQRHPKAGSIALLGWYVLDPLIRIGYVFQGAGAYAKGLGSGIHAPSPKPQALNPQTPLDPHG